MATETDKLTAVKTSNNGTDASGEENRKTTIDSADPTQNPCPVATSAAVTPTTAGLKKDEDDSKTTAAVVPLSGDGAPANDTQKKIRRAERFKMPVQLTEQEKRNSRAERFGTGSKAHGSEGSKASEGLKRRARAERFGLPVPALASHEEAKKKSRLARFAPFTKMDSLEEEKRQARALRFSGPPSSSLPQVNGQGNIEPKEPIAGKAGGGA